MAEDHWEQAMPPDEAGGEAAAPLPGHGHGRGTVTGCDLANAGCLRHPFLRDPFYRMRPPLSHSAMLFSLELASMTYHLEVDDWMAAGWTDVSIQIDNTLQSGLTHGESASGEQMRSLINNWKVNRARRNLRERNPIAQIAGAFRQREKSDTVKAVTMIREAEPGRFVVAVGFMGTGKRFYDWFSNLRFATEEGFHKGFSQLEETFEQSADKIVFPDTAARLGLPTLTLAQVLTEMKRADSRFFLWMAGHSQGAAVMQIFGHRLMTRWGVLPENMVGYGFASPTVATGALVYDPAGYPLYHVINGDDVVPRMGALLHLGLCLHFEADEAFHQLAYAWPQEEESRQLREDLSAFTPDLRDTMGIMEVAVAFCYCLLEDKGEESLNTLIDKKWTVAPIEKALTYAGEKAQDVVASIVAYVESGYASLTGHGMDGGKIAGLKERLHPVVKRHTMRQLMGGLHDLCVLPHMIKRNNFKDIGAYSEIVLHRHLALTPYIWVKGKGLPRKHFAESIPWWDDVPGSTAPQATSPQRRQPSGARRSYTGVRRKGVTAHRAGRKSKQAKEFSP